MVEILNKEEQPLLGRTLLTARMAFEGATPDRKKVRVALAKAAKVKEEQLIVRSMKSGFGAQELDIDAAVYKKLDDAKAVEHKSLMAKHAPAEKPAEEGSEKEESADEQKDPAEEKKE
ncbi:hypothetical protein KY327_03395 [Candidatus Woesearchaeota archaeon]|nr:hypothetical protein [Candidatus Woesearchaeota archaeon]